MTDRSGQRFYPALAPIEAYGNGGFRFAGMSHRGSLLILPSGIYAWPPATAAEAGIDAFALVFAEATAIALLLFGTGEAQIFPAAAIRSAFADPRGAARGDGHGCGGAGPTMCCLPSVAPSPQR